MSVTYEAGTCCCSPTGPIPCTCLGVVPTTIAVRMESASGCTCADGLEATAEYVGLVNELGTDWHCWRAEGTFGTCLLSGDQLWFVSELFMREAAGLCLTAQNLQIYRPAIGNCHNNFKTIDQDPCGGTGTGEQVVLSGTWDNIFCGDCNVISGGSLTLTWSW